MLSRRCRTLRALRVTNMTMSALPGYRCGRTRSSGADSSTRSTTDFLPTEVWESAAGWRTPGLNARRTPTAEADPEKWTGRSRRWRVTPESRIGEAKKPGPSDRLKTCPMCGVQRQMQTRKGKCAICETQTTLEGQTQEECSAKTAWDMERL